VALRQSSEIVQLRRETQRQEGEYESLAAQAASVAQSRALDLAAIELHDLDRVLFDAEFIANDSQIRKLIAEIEAGTAGGRRVVDQIEQIRSALGRVRAAVTAGTELAGRAKDLAAETDALLDLLHQAAPTHG
jgi:hypothetical protein